MYLRTWHHIVRKLEHPSLGYGTQFDVNLFLREALSFAYAEVPYAMGGQLPRPIIKSAFGIELGVAEGDACSNTDATTETEFRSRRQAIQGPSGP
jgi:hypothetical protein